MAMFDFAKKQKSSCGRGCGGDAAKLAGPENHEGARIKILGSGCAKCDQLEAATKAALEKLGMDAAIDHVRDFAKIAAFGVMSTPALVLDGKVLSYGKVLKVDEAVELLRKAGLSD